MAITKNFSVKWPIDAVDRLDERAKQDKKSRNSLLLEFAESGLKANAMSLDPEIAEAIADKEAEVAEVLKQLFLENQFDDEAFAKKHCPREVRWYKNWLKTKKKDLWLAELTPFVVAYIQTGNESLFRQALSLAKADDFKRVFLTFRHYYIKIAERYDLAYFDGLYDKIGITNPYMQKCHHWADIPKQFPLAIKYSVEPWPAYSYNLAEALANAFDKRPGKSTEAKLENEIGPDWQAIIDAHAESWAQCCKAYSFTRSAFDWL